LNLKTTDIINDKSCLTKSEIHRYVNKTATKQERFEIENHLLNCNLCDAALEGYTLHADEVYMSSPKKQFWIYLAAAILLELITAIAFIGYKNANQPATTFAEFYQKPQWDGQSRGENESDQYTQAIQIYNQGNYAAALSAFEDLIKTNPEDNQLRLYQGIAYLENGNLSLAEDELQTVRINSDIYFEEASWYLALLKVRSKNNVEASHLLEELLNIKNGFYHEQATQLKNELQD